VAFAGVGVVLVALLLFVFTNGAESDGPVRPGVGKPPSWWMEAMDASQTRRRWGAVSSTHNLVTQAGFAALEAGGNAVDAAAAMQFMLNVVQPQSSGIGGGSFVVIHNAATGEVSTLDGREEAPNTFHENAFCAGADCAGGECECLNGILGTYQDRQASGHSVGVPGTAAAVDRMLREHGTFALKDAVSFAVQRAREGFPMYEDLHSKIAAASVRMQHFDASSRLFLTKNKRSPIVEIGETFTNPDLADTLEQLAEEGIDQLFYKGRLADEIVETTRAAMNPTTKRGGVMTKDDISNYRAVFRRPMNTTYRGYQVFGMGPPSAGAVAVVEALNVLEGFDLSEMSHNSADYLHTIADAMNLAWADSDTYLADADFTDMPLHYQSDDYCQKFADEGSCPTGCMWEKPYGASTPLMEPNMYMAGRGKGCSAVGLLSKAYARARRDVHSRTRVLKSPLPSGKFPALNVQDWTSQPDTPDRSGTTHFSVVDKAGNMVSMTSTIQDNFGSGIVVSGRGFVLNSQMTQFSFDQQSGSGKGYANRPEGGRKLRKTALGPDAGTSGGKRPRSSMTPTLVLDPAGKAMLAIGSPGGSRSPFTVLGALLSVMDFGMNLKQAIDAPRAIACNGPLEMETRLECQCTNPLGEESYLMSVLKARGMMFSSGQGKGSETSESLAAVMVFSNGTFDGYADSKRVPSALGYGA